MARELTGPAPGPVAGAEVSDPQGLFDPPAGYPPRSAWQRGCTACGACCTAPDIAALAKPLGVPCTHLGAGCLCRVYEQRPAVCRSYQPDWVCGEVAPLPTLESRVTRFLEIYGLEAERA